MASAGGEGTSYGGTGGAGGKFRKKPFRKPQATPYDRPQNAIRNPNDKGWLSKFVDPASKLISASAHLLFNSVLRKRLPPPPAPPQPEASRGAEERSQQEVFNNGHGVQGPIAPTINNDNSGLSELEKILKQKTFTRSEIESLTELLQSRTVDLPNGDDQNGSKSNHQQLIPTSGRQERIECTPVQEKDMGTCGEESHRLKGSVQTPLFKPQVLEDSVAAPAELAKAYMGSRPSKMSPSVLGFRSRASREDGSMLSNSAFPPSSPVMSLVRKPAVNFGISENGFMTPRSRGRSAIYNMARTPYSRGPSTSSQQGAGSVYDTYSGQSALISSQFTPDRDGHYSSKQSTLKRRSSVLEDEIGSVGPIRRLRQKINLAPPRNLSGTGTPFRYVNGVGSDGSQNAMTSAQKLHSLDESKHKSSKAVGEYENNSMPSTSYSQVPSKSTETAARILQQLEKIVPKERSSEGKSLSVRDKSPSKLTSNMLRGQALKSTEDVDSSKFLYNATDKKISSPGIHKHDKAKESVPIRSIGTSDASAGISRSNLVQEAATVAKTAESHKPESMKSSPKQGFRMTAIEDFEDLDDENHSNVAASTLLEEGKGKLEVGLVESKSADSSGNPSMDKSSTPELRISAAIVFNKSTDSITSDGIVSGQENSAFSFSAPSSGAVSQPDGASAFEKEPRVSPLSFAHDEKVGSLVNSSSAVGESLVPERSSQLSVGPKSGFTGIVSKPTFDKVENNDAQKSGSALGNPEVSSTLSASTSTSSIFSFSSNSNLSNGTSDSRLPTSSLASPVQFSDATKPSFTNTPSNNASFTSATNSISAASTSASNSSPTLAAGSSPPAFPSFRFGANSEAPSNSVSTVAATSNSGTTNLLPVKSEKETSGNQASLPSNGTSFLSLGSQGSIFGFNTTANSSSPANNLSQSSLIGSGSGSLASTESSLFGTGSAAVAQSAPVQFGSSASSPVFATSAAQSFSSGISVFGSSTSGSLASGSSSGSFSFGSSGSGSFAFGSSGTSSTAFGSSGSGSSTFGSSSSSPMFGSSTSATPTFGSSTSATPTFGSSTSATPTFGSTTSATPTFGASTSATQTASTSASPTFGASTFGSSMFGGSSAGSSMFGASTSGGSMFGSLTTGSSVFGSSTSSGPTFGSSTSTTPMFGSSTPSPVFSFGASSVSAAATNNAPLVFGSSTSASSGPIFSFTSASASAPSSQPQPVFGSPFPAFTASPGNNGDQMSMEDSMAEDTTPKVPTFGQSPIAASPPGFMFGSPAPSTGTPSFQFGGQPSQPNVAQNPSLFQASGSLGGSFSLGSGGPTDKSGRRIVKVSKNRRKK